MVDIYAFDVLILVAAAMVVGVLYGLWKRLRHGPEWSHTHP